MTEAKKLKISISEEAGAVSALLILPHDASCLLVLSHGAGANMEHAFMEELARQLAVYKVGTLRFNFPYMEKGGGAPDRPPKAQATIQAAVEKAMTLAEGRTLLAGGKSFGGRMTSQLAAAGGLQSVKGIVYYGFPLHQAGKPGAERAVHLAAVPQPQLFLQGTRDTLAQFDLIEAVCAGLPKARLVKMEGGDHSFKTLKRSGITHEQVMDRLARETAEFAAGF